MRVATSPARDFPTCRRLREGCRPRRRRLARRHLEAHGVATDAELDVHDRTGDRVAVRVRSPTSVGGRPSRIARSRNGSTCSLPG